MHPLDSIQVPEYRMDDLDDIVGGKKRIDRFNLISMLAYANPEDIQDEKKRADGYSIKAGQEKPDTMIAKDIEVS